MIVTTVNANGIRAAVKQRSETNLGLLPWLKETAADVICLQETRADDEQLADALSPALAARHLGATGMLGIDSLQGHKVSIDFERQMMSVSRSEKRSRRLPARADEVVVTATRLPAVG